MKSNVILIKDSWSRAFLVTIWTPSTATNFKFWNCDRTRYQAGDWEAINKGYIQPTRGDAFLTSRRSPVVPGYCFSGAGDRTYVDLYMGKPDSIDGHDNEYFRWGIALYKYTDGFGGVQDGGTGEVLQNWVQSLHPGLLTWKKATESDVATVSSTQAQEATPK
jgi:hypothetical protein